MGAFKEGFIQYSDFTKEPGAIERSIYLDPFLRRVRDPDSVQDSDSQLALPFAESPRLRLVRNVDLELVRLKHCS